MPKLRSKKLNPFAVVGLAVTAACLVMVGLFALSKNLDTRSAAALAPVRHVGASSGGSTKEKTVSASVSLAAQTGNRYVASVSMKPWRPVTEVSGLGLTWVRSKSQCAARSATGVEVWTAQGTPTADGSVTATFGNAPENATLVVSAFADVAEGSTIQMVSSNTLGINGACTGGTDTQTYSLQVPVQPNSITYAVVGERLRTTTPGAGFVKLTEVHQGNSDGDKSGLAVLSQSNTGQATQTVSGTLNSATDWAMVTMVVQGMQSTGPTPTATPLVTPVPTGSAQPTDSPVPTGAPVSTATPAPTASPTLPPTSASIGIWTSAAELKTKGTDTDAWKEVLAAANSLSSTPAPNLDNQDDKTNTDVLAAAIVYAKTGDAQYKNKVVSALQKVEQFVPKGRTLAWARETGAYAMAADLVGYRTPAFEKKMRDMAETYRCTEVKNANGDPATLLEMFQKRPNNWGTMAFGSLTAIYRYLGDTAKLQLVRDHFVQEVAGPKPGTTVYDQNLTWQCDESKPRLINPDGCVKTCGGKLVNVSGILPDDMRRGGDCRQDAVETGYPWEAMQGVVMGARVLERAGMPVWAADNRAICRAAETLQSQRFGTWTKAQSNDLWQLPIIDKACGTRYQDAYTTATDKASLWKFGKNAGWGYVL